MTESWRSKLAVPSLCTLLLSVFQDIEDTDSNSDNSYYRGRLMGNTKGNSFTNSPSSTMSPQSSVCSTQLWAMLYSSN